MPMVLALLLVLTFSALTCGQATVADPLDSVSFMIGSWSQSDVVDDVEMTTSETWTRKRDELIGQGSLKRNGVVVFTESLRISVDEQGRLVYDATPRGQPQTRFTQASVEKDHVRFENPNHDFPQAIEYRLDGPDKLIAMIQGNTDGQAQRRTWQFTRRPE